MRRLLALFALLAATPACSTLGEQGSFPDAYPHGGTGQFRALESDEVGIFDGRALALQGVAMDAAMVADGYLFYASARLLETPPEVPMDQPMNEVFWPAFEPRAIHRADPRENLGFASGPVVFSASASWEGAEVFDPWVVVDDDGSARMYYAAEGGIGVAEAPSVDGAFTRVGDAPILGPDDAVSGAPRRPSVVRGIDGAWWMYFDAGGAIGIARSTDGVAFARIDGDASTAAIDPLILTGQDDRESPEIAIGSPGAAAVDTVVGRRLIRIYYESRREDGTVLPYVAGSADGVTFERHEIPVMDSTDVRFPAPVLVDDRTTLLYWNGPLTSSGRQTRALRASVSPASVHFGMTD